MFRVTRYPMISKTESGRVGYRKKYLVAGRVRVPAGHWWQGNLLDYLVLDDVYDDCDNPKDDDDNDDNQEDDDEGPLVAG